MSDKPTIHEALSSVMGDVQSVRKGDRNTQQGYIFRGIDAVVNAVGPALRKHGVVIMPHVEDVQYAVVEVGQKRTPMRECTVRVRYSFHGPAGDTLECVTVGEAMDSGDKSTPKALSVALRVALLQALCIPTDEPDVDSVAHQRAPRMPTVDRMARARRAIAEADGAEELDRISRYVASLVDDGELSDEDAAGLRQALQVRLDGAPPDVAGLRRTLYPLLPADCKGKTEEARQRKLNLCAAVIGRAIGSTDDMTPDEWRQVIAALREAERQPPAGADEGPPA